MGSPSIIELGSDDKKANAMILDSMSICAHDHVPSRKLLDRVSTASGPMFAIVGDWIDLDQLASYDDYMAAPAGEVASGERTTERLVAFVGKYSRTIKDALVLCENWGAERKHVANWPWPPPRVAYYGDNEVYHILTPDITDPELIEAAVAPRHHW